MKKEFNITSVCRDDIVGMIENSKDETINKVLFIRMANEITDEEMKWMASKLADGFCNCCFWGMLEDRFKQLIEEKLWVMKKK